MTDRGHESNALRILPTAEPPFRPERPQAITFTIEYPPGHPGAAPHRHPGPAFGYVVEGESRHDRRAPSP